MKAKFLLGGAAIAVLTAIAVGGSRSEPDPKRTEPKKVGQVQSVAMTSRLKDLPRAREAALLLSPLRPGEKAPDFTLPDQNGQMHRLSELRGKTVVLSFYPQDFTYLCMAQAVSLTEARPAFQARNAVVFSVSVQPVDSKQHVAQEFGINYPLLADTQRKVAREYRVLNKDGLAGRVTFIIGPDGFIVSTDQKVHATTHATDILARIDRGAGAQRQQTRLVQQNSG